MVIFREVEHTADVALHVQGRDLSELLVNAARGMTSLLCPGADVVASVETRECEVVAFDAEGLLVEWLSELAYWAEKDRFVCAGIDVLSLSPTHMRAVCRGGRALDLYRHIKAVTYHNLQIVRTEHGLQTTIVFDV